VPNECFACIHPARELIDNFCLNRNVTIQPSGERITTAAELREHLQRVYPDAPVPSEVGISKHSNRHINRTTDLQLVDGVLCDAKGKALPGYSVEDSLKAVIAIAVRNALSHPENVTVKQGLDAIALLWKLKNGITEQDDYNELWASVVKGQLKQPKRRGRPKKVEIDDGSAIEGECETVG
jgi:hypothetical protein